MPSAGSRLLSGLTGLWGPRILWLVVGVSGMLSIGDAVDGRSEAVRATVTITAWVLWGVGVVALVVPSALGLTVMRMLSGVACGAAVVSWVGGAAPVPGGAFVACTLMCGLLVGGADFGQRCVQASAYGDERRFLLRPPAAFVIPITVAGLLWGAAVLAAPLLLAVGQWIFGGVVAIVAICLTWVLVPRFNTLSRRWLVLVPAGVVVHDQVVLAETLMIPRAEVAGISLAMAGTEAADLTGPASGHAVEIGLRGMVTALLAPNMPTPPKTVPPKTMSRGTTVHVHSFIVAPTRPGAVLRAALTDGLVTLQHGHLAMPPPST